MGLMVIDKTMDSFLSSQVDGNDTKMTCRPTVALSKFVQDSLPIPCKFPINMQVFDRIHKIYTKKFRIIYIIS